MVIKHKSKNYDDIIHLPHHVSKKRRPMPLTDRAAQFAPFSAVVGYDAAVKEAARLTEEKRDLDEGEKTVINEQLNLIQENIADEATIEIIYFKADVSKNGGAYVSHVGCVKKIDSYTASVFMVDGLIIPIDDIYKIIN